MVANSKKVKYQYRICAEYFEEDPSNSTLLIQDTITLKTVKLRTIELAKNFDLIAKFHPKDIYTIAYVVAQQRLIEEKQLLKSLAN